MIELTVLKTRTEISPLFFAVLTAFLLADKSGFGFMAVIFSALHEIGHFAALAALKTHAKNVKVSVFGIEMKLPANLGAWEKCIVFSAGFTVNFILAACFWFCGRLSEAYINIIIGVFTALPMAATDGGAILSTIFEDVFCSKRNVYKTVSSVVSFILAVAFITIAERYKNYYMLIGAVYMVLSALKEKNQV